MIQQVKQYSYEELLSMYARKALPAIKIEFCTDIEVNYLLRYLSACTGLKIESSQELSLYISRRIKNLLISEFFEVVEYYLDGKLKHDKAYSITTSFIAQIINSYTYLKQLDIKGSQLQDERLSKLTEAEKKVFNTVQKLHIEFKQKIEYYGSSIRLSFFEIHKNFTLLYSLGFIHLDLKTEYRNIKTEFLNLNTRLLEQDTRTKVYKHFSDFWTDEFEFKKKEDKMQNMYYVEVCDMLFEKALKETVDYYSADQNLLQRDWDEKINKYSVKETGKKIDEIIKIFYSK